MQLFRREMGLRALQEAVPCPVSEPDSPVAYVYMVYHSVPTVNLYITNIIYISTIYTL